MGYWITYQPDENPEHPYEFGAYSSAYGLFMAEATTVEEAIVGLAYAEADLYEHPWPRIVYEGLLREVLVNPAEVLKDMHPWPWEDDWGGMVSSHPYNGPTPDWTRESTLSLEEETREEL